MAKKKDDDSLDKVTLGIRLGSLPESTVDAMFAGLAWQAERDHGAATRALVAATFAAARIEAEIMSDNNHLTKDRLTAAKQFKEGFREACSLVNKEPINRKRASIVVGEDEADPSVPSALERMYGNQE
jgi:hypothetical protein|tara:strand:+ start:485 stop:868 length:384 start_codon:yes stop_codon:yes gene_type:complete